MMIPLSPCAPIRKLPRLLALVLIGLQASAPLSASAQSAATPAGPRPMLHIVILEGEDALNNVRGRTAREPIVQVQDENHKPVAGALVLFSLNPGSSGASASFAGSASLSVVTDSQGIAVAKGFRPNDVVGDYTVSITASAAGALTEKIILHESNVIGTVASSASKSSSSGSKASTAAKSGLRVQNFGWVAITGATIATVAAVTAVRSNGAKVTPGTGTIGP